MIQIRPVSDLRNKFPEIETIVNSGNPVYLTKNGYGSMVVLSLEEYASLTNNVEMKLDEADRQAAATEERLSHESAAPPNVPPGAVTQVITNPGQAVFRKKHVKTMGMNLRIYFL